MNHPTYVPEPGGDLILYADLRTLTLVHFHGDQARRILRLALEDEGLPREFLSRLHSAFDTYQPIRLVVSVATPPPPVHVLALLTVVARDLVRPGQVEIVEAPDIVRVAAAIQSGEPDVERTVSRPSKPGGRPPLLGWSPTPAPVRLQRTLFDYLRPPVCA